MSRISIRQTVIERSISKHYIPIDRARKALHVFMCTREDGSFTAEMAFTDSGIYDIEDARQLNRISIRQTVIERSISQHYIPIDRARKALHALIFIGKVAV